MKGLLLAGGHGTRLRPLTFTGNKHMLPIANKPMLLYGLEHMRNAGINEIGIILGPIKEGVEEVIGNGTDFGVKVTYIDQPDPKGLAHAVLISEDYLQGEPFVMYLGDNLLRDGVTPLVDLFNSTSSDCVVGTTQVTNPSSYGVVVFKEDGSAERFVEKPKEYISDWSLIGVYVFNDKVFDAVKNIKPSWRGELEITDTIQYLLQNNAKVQVQKLTGWWKDTGKPDDLLEANQLCLQELPETNKGTLEEDVKIWNKAHISEDTIIKKGTTIIGPIIIGSDCTIGPDTRIGPYTSIGDQCTIENSDIENTIIMNGAHIQCNKRIADSLIGRNVTITSTNNSTNHNQFILGDQAKLRLE